jgi:Leucine-rich repeat (LRR) protein
MNADEFLNVFSNAIKASAILPTDNSFIQLQPTMSSLVVLIAFISVSYTSAETLECGSQFGFMIATSCRVTGGSVPPGDSLTISNADPTVITLLTFSGTNFTTLPSNIFISFPLIQTFYVSMSDLKQIRISDFKNGLKLKNLFFYKTQMQVVPSQVFRLCQNIDQLTLSTSPIERIAKGAFGSLRKLTALSLTYLPLTTFPNNMLANLTALVEFTFEDCGLTTLPSDFFINNQNLTKLLLKNNKLESLPDDIFDPLERLSSVNLENNNLLKVVTGRAREFQAQKNQIQEIHISAFASYVNVDNNFIEKITCDEGLNVTMAYFSNNSLTNLNCLRNMASAFQMILDNNKFAKLTAKAFNNLQSIKTLSLNGNPELKATSKMFAPLTKLKELRVDRLVTGYKNLRQQYPDLSMLYLTTRSWNCSFLKQVANTLNSQRIYLRFINEYQDFVNFKCQLKMWEVSKFT